ncbi:MAG: hypothetical protein H7239_05610 [Flavobacterium sp.]|nr:hypothetical protein [Flavobacterium sp.]
MRTLLSFLIASLSGTMIAQVGIGTTTPYSQFDVTSSSQTNPASTDGILIPRVDKFPTSNPSSNQQGMLVYLTTTTTAGKTPGFYYWDFPTLSWVNMVSTNNVGTILGDVVNLEDFLFDAYGGSGGNDNQYAFTAVGTSSNVDGTAALYASYGAGNDYAGIHRLSTSSSATGKSSVGSFGFIDRLKLGSIAITYEIRVRFSALSTANQTFSSVFGLCDLVSGSGVSTIANGVYFQYTTAGLVGRCRNSTSTTTATAATAIAAYTWYKLKAVVNAAGTNVDFYVDSTLIGSVTTNIPT